jgi:hypothetical protein
MVFRQDLPSAALLRRRGITRAVVVLEGGEMADDVRHVLYAWQEGGIAIAVKAGAQVEATRVEAPPWLQRVLRRPAGAGELQRNAGGSFSRWIPELPVREPSHG